MVELKGGGAIETGMIGRDGTFGASQALDDKVSLNHVVIQLAGTASLMASNHLRQQAAAQEEFRAVLIKYDQFFLAQVQHPSPATLFTTSRPVPANGFCECMN